MPQQRQDYFDEFIKGVFGQVQAEQQHRAKFSEDIRKNLIIPLILGKESGRRDIMQEMLRKGYKPKVGEMKGAPEAVAGTILPTGEPITRQPYKEEERVARPGEIIEEKAEWEEPEKKPEEPPVEYVDIPIYGRDIKTGKLLKVGSFEAPRGTEPPRDPFGYPPKQPAGAAKRKENINRIIGDLLAGGFTDAKGKFYSVKSREEAANYIRVQGGLDPEETAFQRVLDAYPVEPIKQPRGKELWPKYWFGKTKAEKEREELIEYLRGQLPDLYDPTTGKPKISTQTLETEEPLTTDIDDVLGLELE